MPPDAEHGRLPALLVDGSRLDLLLFGLGAGGGALRGAVGVAWGAGTALGLLLAVNLSSAGRAGLALRRGRQLLRSLEGPGLGGGVTYEQCVPGRRRDRPLPG